MKSVSLLVTILVACLFSAEEMNAAGPLNGMIDIHTHLIGVTAGRRGATDYPGAVAGALSSMDRTGVAISVVMPDRKSVV